MVFINDIASGDTVVNNKRLALSSMLALVLLMTVVVAQQAGETVTVDQPQASDQYLAGRLVQVTAPIEGDLVIAGQELVVDAEIGGDVIAAGQSLSLRDTVADDVRAAGWTLSLDAQIMGHAVAAGGEIVLGSEASVGDWAWFAGRSVTVEGRVGADLRAAGESVLVSGEVGGDAVLAAEEIQIGSGAIIRGDLIWDSEVEPEIAESATVEGEIIREDFAAAFQGIGPYRESGGVASAIFSAIALVAAVFTVYLIFPSLSGSVANRIRSMPLRTLGLGIGMIAGIPLVIVLLFLSRIGWILAIGVLLGYLLLLLCAMLFGVVTAGKLGLELTKKDETSRLPVHLLAIGLGVVVVLLLAQIPVLGTIVLLLVLFSGLGGISGEFWQRYRQPA
jgi:cytoskeletal protein CcmA (bactofilin family)